MSIFDKLLKAIEEGDVSEVEASWRNWNWEGKVNIKLRILVTCPIGTRHCAEPCVSNLSS